ncbi:hypothetical protein R3P38DRAFT_3239946 [Favolaschia claudopus]|uniref:Uncharacterized protein n=1 Tax=Favolaschia claudopus TaxID=2862362 RepID=A0AAV9Z747_9AGAR
MPVAALERCVDDEDRQTRRLQAYRRYRRNHQEKCRASGRERMARLRARQSEEQRARHRETQRRYRERCAESINHRARRALVRKNAAAGKQTKARPKARQYYSDPDLITDEEEDDEEDW